MNKFILGSVVLVLGVILGWYVFRSSSAKSVTSFSPSGSGSPTVSSPSPSADVGQPAATDRVKLTDSGFVPASLTVKVGTTVRFTNESSGGMHIASNPHPTHTLLPGFDELTSVDKGGFYDYQFVKVGTWGYHNHLTPSVTGKVIVTP